MSKTSTLTPPETQKQNGVAHTPDAPAAPARKLRAHKPRRSKPAVEATKPRTAAGRPTQSGAAKLGKAHIRILQALKQAGRPITRTRINEICAKTFPTAKKFSAWMTAPLGQADPKARKLWEKKSGKPSLLALGYVRMIELNIDGAKENVFELTAAGRKTLEKT